MSRAVIIGLILLTLFNAGLLAWQISKIRRSGVAWRKVFAMLPVPMLGAASSYGVFAFNTLFVPPIVAALMAAAYETVYIGLPALDNLTPAQQKLASTIAAWSGWVSFTQNAIAGFLFTSIGARVYLRITTEWELWDSAKVMILLSSLHGAQVWINYHAARLTFHRNSIADNPASTPAIHVKAIRRPTRLGRPAPLQTPSLPAASTIDLNAQPALESANVNTNPEPNRKNIRTKDYDPSVIDEWMRLNDQKVSYRDIEKRDPSYPSHVTIRSLVKARRAELAAEQPARPKLAPVFTLDDLLIAAGLDRTSAKGTLTKYGLLTSDKAYSGLKRFGKLPQGMDESTFASLYAELMN